MPKFINPGKLPEPLYKALTYDTYTKGRADVSVTELLKSPRQRLLSKRHDHEIEIDATDNLWLMLGRAAHNVLKNAANILEGGFDGMAEERLFVKVPGPKGEWTLSGEFDLMYQDGKTLVLSDYKVSGVFGFLLEKQSGGVKSSWEQQLNIYRWMLHKHGFDIQRLEIGGIMRDWIRSKAEKDPTYPQKPIVILEVPIWPLEEVEEFVKERVKIHQEAEAIQDDALPLCSPSERWERGEAWAVYQDKKVRALRVFDNPHEAEACAKEVKGRVEYRPGVSARCNPSYCYGQPWCSQAKKENGKP